MVRLELFGDNLGNTEYKVTRYVNDNVNTIIRTLLDLLEDDNDFEAEDFLPRNNLRIDNQTWKEMLYDLEDIVQSEVLRDYIKPKYQYLLYIILWWWDECTDNKNDLISIELDEELVDEIKEKYEDDEGNCRVLNAITNYEEYYYLFFEDFAFLPHTLETMVTIYLRSRNLFEMFYPDVNLEEYHDLMPRDLQEQYDELKTQKNNEEKRVSIEQVLYEDIIFCCERIQADNSLKNSVEDEINDRFRDLLEAKGYIERDQTRQGASASGKRAGEVDILIKRGKMPLSLIEALKLTSVNESYIAEHIDKIYKYDTLGYKYNFLVSYVKIKDFKEFWDKYVKFVCSYKYPFEMIEYKIDISKQYSELRSIEIILNRNGIETKLYNVVVHMPN